LIGRVEIPDAGGKARDDEAQKAPARGTVSGGEKAGSAFDWWSQTESNRRPLQCHLTVFPQKGRFYWFFVK
jgi:hypothetical protein